MNRAFCNTCKKLVPADRDERDGKVFLVKHCPECGDTESLVSADAQRHMGKRSLDPGYEYHRCGRMNCVSCTHHRHPSYAFVDVTNRCNLNCPMCADSVGGYGFAFDPPMYCFDKIFDHLEKIDPLPTIALFGGEPTVRDELLDIIANARARGFRTRVLTNGVRLADEEYCRKIVASRAHLLFSYDGDNPETYRVMRNSAKVLEKKKQAIENLKKSKRAPRVSYVTVLAWGLNEEELPQIIDFYHSQRRFLHGVYLMPLVHTWDTEEFGYAPERMTTEDVEVLFSQAFPDTDVQFISLGLASHYRTISKYFGRPSMPYYGCHPNCESFYMLISDGEKYLPVDHFLKTSLPEVAEALLDLERRLIAREERRGRVTLWLRTLGRIQTITTVLRHVKLGAFFKGKGIGKVGHFLAMLFGVLFRRKSLPLRERHMNVQNALPIIILPLEDDQIIETDRLERCCSVHVYYDPRTDAINYIPVCSWRLHNHALVRELKDAFEAQAAGKKTDPQPEEAEAPAEA